LGPGLSRSNLSAGRAAALAPAACPAVYSFVLEAAGVEDTPGEETLEVRPPSLFVNGVECLALAHGAPAAD
jgi:hypothetical protein